MCNVHAVQVFNLILNNFVNLMNELNSIFVDDLRAWFEARTECRQKMFSAGLDRHVIPGHVSHLILGLVEQVHPVFSFLFIAGMLATFIIALHRLAPNI